MTKHEDEDTLAENSQALEKQNQDLMVASDKVPDFFPKGNAEGATEIAISDARIPRLILAQPQSHQVLDGDPLYIEGLTPGMSFNDLSGEIYGKAPIDCIVIRADKPRWVEFAEDRSVIDPNVPFGDPRTEFTTGPKGERIPPVATKFYDYVILRGPQLEPLAWSCKSTAIKFTAHPLNGLIKSKTVPIYGCWYRLTPKAMKNDKGTWYIYIPKQVGFVSNQEVYNRAKEYFEIFRVKKVDFETAPDPGGDTEAETTEI